MSQVVSDSRAIGFSWCAIGFSWFELSEMYCCTRARPNYNVGFDILLMPTVMSSYSIPYCSRADVPDVPAQVLQLHHI